MFTRCTRMLGATRSRSTLREIKVKVDGSKTKTFDLEFLYKDKDCVVGKWTANEDSYGLEKGSYSYGVWFFGKCWTAYRIHRPCGELVKYRFDACEYPEFSNDDGDVPEILFRDLLLDVNVYITEKETLRIQFEDRDEVDASLNILDQNQIILINRFTDVFENRPEDPISHVNSAIERAAVEPPE